MSNWKIVKLSDACEIILGQSPESITYNTNGKCEYKERLIISKSLVPPYLRISRWYSSDRI